MECTSLWIQQRLRLKELEVRKIAGESIPADLFRKHLKSKAKLDQPVQLFNCDFWDGRAASAFMLKKGLLAGASADESIHLPGASRLPRQHAAKDIDHLPVGAHRP